MISRTVCLAILLAFVSASIAPAFAQDAVSDPEIKVLEQGSKPRIAIRLQPETGQKEAVSMTMDMNMAVSISGMEMPQQKIPGQIFTIGAEATEVADDGRVSYTFEYTRADVISEGAMPEIVAAMREQHKALIGLKGNGVVSDRNLIESFAMDIPETFDPMAAQNLESIQRSMREFSTPFPEEAMGVGGKWQVLNEVDNMGMKIVQTTTYEVTAISKKAVTLDLTVVQTAEPQDLVMQGMNFHLDEFHSEGSGGAVFDRNRILPRMSSVSLDMTMKMSADVQGQAQVMNMEMGMDMKMERKEGE